jgi:hypothetical protein
MIELCKLFFQSLLSRLKTFEDFRFLAEIQVDLPDLLSCDGFGTWVVQVRNELFLGLRKTKIGKIILDHAESFVSKI